MRAVLLPSIGDPFALSFWLYCFNKWGKNVDEVYVSIGSRPGKYQDVIDYCKSQLKDFEFVGAGEEMNTAFNDLLMNPMPEETFLLIQDDAYVFDPGIIDSSFRAIEEGWTDIVASNQFTYPAFLNDYLTKLYPLEAHQANRGLAFYPNFFFGKVKDIQNAKTGIRVQQWPEGPNEYLKTTLNRTADMDLMGALSLELRHKGLRWQYVPQYQDGYWEQWKDRKIPWTHVTGLSPIWNGIQGGVDKSTPSAYPHNIMLQRLTWHVLFYEMFELPAEIQWFADEYNKVINDTMEVSGVTREELEPRIQYFKELL